MRFGSLVRIDPFALALGLYGAILVFGALSTGWATETALQIAGVVCLAVWVILERIPTVLESALDRRAYLFLGVAPIGTWFGIIALLPTGDPSRVGFWITLIFSGFAVLITGQRRNAGLLRERNRIHERVSGQRSRWSSLLWTMGGSAIGILAIELAMVGLRPVGEFLHHLAPLVVGTAIGGTIGHVLVDHSNAVELLVLDDALVVVAQGRWAEHPIDWRRIRTVEIEDETLHVRTFLWSASFHCDLSDVERPREVARAFRDRAEVR